MTTHDSALDDMTLQVDDPDTGPLGMPAFDGFAENAHKVLRPGRYTASVEDTGRLVQLVVTDTASYIATEIPGGPQ